MIKKIACSSCWKQAKHPFSFRLLKLEEYLNSGFRPKQATHLISPYHLFGNLANVDCLDIRMYYEQAWNMKPYTPHFLIVNKLSVVSLLRVILYHQWLYTNYWLLLYLSSCLYYCYKCYECYDTFYLDPQQSFSFYFYFRHYKIVMTVSKPITMMDTWHHSTQQIKEQKFTAVIGPCFTRNLDHYLFHFSLYIKPRSRLRKLMRTITVRPWKTE